ncbi:MAG: flavin reductase family protein [Pseudomonadota bacterium]
MSDTSASRSEFIAAMRRIASSICVVTTDGAAGRHGATVSAFCAVSADPPTVLVCLNAGSQIAGRVAANRTFRVNVLPRGAEDLAERFAGQQDAWLADRFEGLATTGTPPGFADATALTCALERRVRAGTHDICIGRVVGVSLGTGLPLTYLAGRYHPLCSDPGEARP